MALARPSSRAVDPATATCCLHPVNVMWLPAIVSVGLGGSLFGRDELSKKMDGVADTNR